MESQGAFQALRPERLRRGVSFPVDVATWILSKLHSLVHWHDKMLISKPGRGQGGGCPPMMKKLVLGCIHNVWQRGGGQVKLFLSEKALNALTEENSPSPDPYQVLQGSF